MEDYDRYAPLAQSESKISYERACEIVRDAYQSFSPKMTDVFDKFMENNWIDVPVREGKRGGAFCAYTVSSHHPFVMLNWTANRNDVLTLAHELGHACHAYLAKDQGTFHQDTGLTFCETASVFAESVTFNRLLEEVSDPKEQLELLAAYIDGQIATVFRQIAMHNFETAVHTHRRTIGELKLILVEYSTRHDGRLSKYQRKLWKLVELCSSFYFYAWICLRLCLRSVIGFECVCAISEIWKRNGTGL